MTQPAPIFSIITPTYKRPELLKRAIQSVLAQTFTDWEMCIVDNHSPDDTLKVIRGFDDPRLKVTQIHNDGIIAKSRNTAIDMARGSYLAFLDADDWWTPEKLSVAHAACAAGADFFYHDLKIVSEKSDLKKYPTLVAQSLDPPCALSLATKGGVIPNSSVVVKRSLLQTIGPISEDTDLVAAEDYDCWLRCAQITDAFVFSDQQLGYYWHAGNSMTQASRTLRWGAALRRKYPQYDFPWLSYTLARAYYSEGLLDQAYGEIKSAQMQQMPQRQQVRFRALWGVVQLKRLLHRFKAPAS